MDNPTITYDELKAALLADECTPDTDPALYALLRKCKPESLFGRWATHPEYGRGIITSIKPDSTGEVRFAYRHSSYTDGAETRFARPESLTIDPLALITGQDFEDAPEGAIAETITEPRYVYTKARGVWYATGSKYYIPSHEVRECRVIRWGNGQ